ncbi:MAG: fructosamine kinase family protein [Planctomycetota bacterium]
MSGDRHPDPARRALAAALEGRSWRSVPLASGRTGEVLRVDADGEALVAKLDSTGEGGLEVEGQMLRHVAARSDAPVPRVHHACSHALVMEWCPGRTGVREEAAESAAEGLAALHAVEGSSFGYHAPTRIGGLVQPNPEHSSWLDFFAEARLVGPARAARDEGRLDASTAALVESVAARIGDHANEPSAPALVHGDLWSGNVLSEGSALTAFLDPALYHGHPEVDLAFATMFGGFPRRFFDAYRDRVGGDLLDAGFWDTRRDLWNLYPLLVHVRLFGGGYVDELRRTAARLA